jgi:hypothetical protein
MRSGVRLGGLRADCCGTVLVVRPGRAGEAVQDEVQRPGKGCRARVHAAGKRLTIFDGGARLKQRTCGWHSRLGRPAKIGDGHQCCELRIRYIMGNEPSF